MLYGSSMSNTKYKEVTRARRLDLVFISLGELGEVVKLGRVDVNVLELPARQPRHWPPEF